MATRPPEFMPADASASFPTRVRNSLPGRYILVPLWLLATGKWGRLEYWVRRHILRNSVFVEEWEMGMCSLSPAKVWALLLSECRPASLLDVGAGCGMTVSHFVEAGVDAIGMEGSRLAIRKSKHPERMIQHDLEKPIDLGRKFDLVWSFEVAEHIRPERAPVFVDTLVRHGDRVVFSAAPPGQGGDGHFNEQPAAYWIGMMDARGYQFDAQFSARLKATGDEHAENLMAFSRRVPGQTYA